MNSKQLILISLLCIFIFGCKKPKKVFTVSDNLIELIAVRQKAPIDYANYCADMSTKDGSNLDKVYPDIRGIPDSLHSVKVYYHSLDIIQTLFQSYKAGMVEKKTLDYYCNFMDADTTNCSSNHVKSFVIIATGISENGQRYYLFDSNNNYDLGDEISFEAETVPVFGMNPKSELQPHKIIYEKYLDNMIQKDSTWIAFNEQDGKSMWYRICEHTSTSFQFDSLSYNIELYPSKGVWVKYQKSAFFKISEGPNTESKLYSIGEYIRLGNSNYQLDCSRDGLNVYLAKDTSTVMNTESTQVGMAPLAFKARTYSGDTINFPSDFKGKYVLLDFWGTWCGSCVQEIRDYYIDIYEKYGGDQFEIIGVAYNLPHELDDFIETNNINWPIIPDGEQKKILKKYKIFSYPTLVLINPEGIIISKGEELRSGEFVSILDENITDINNAR